LSGDDCSGVKAIGLNTSAGRKKMKFAGRIPTTAWFSPLRAIVRPTSDRSPPNRLCQSP
jgi:hypothetical protein